MTAILIVGNPIDGYEFFGPFASGDDAAEYMYRIDYDGGDWWVAGLDEPEVVFPEPTIIRDNVPTITAHDIPLF